MAEAPGRNIWMPMKITAIARIAPVMAVVSFLFSLSFSRIPMYYSWLGEKIGPSPFMLSSLTETSRLQNFWPLLHSSIPYKLDAFEVSAVKSATTSTAHYLRMIPVAGVDGAAIHGP